jgi:hypothetical protein
MESQYLIYLRKKYSWQYFREKAKVFPGTYSEIFARNLYISVFEFSINTIEEYKKYYEKEYENISQFLFWRYGISEEILAQIPEIPHGFLVIFNFDYRIDEDEILRTSIEQLFREIEGEI